MTVTLLRLAVSLAYSRERAQRWRQLSVCCGGLILALAVLLSMAVVDATTAAAHRRAYRMPVLALNGESTPLLVSLRGETWRKRQFPVLWLAPGRPGARLVPPGLRALPPPGTAALSPGLVSAGFRATGLGFRPASTGTGPGGTIGAEGLASASEWLVYARPPAGRGLGAGGLLFHVKGYGPRSGEPTMAFETDAPTPSPSGARFGVGWLFVLPALLLGVSCAVALSDVRRTRAQTLLRLGLSRAALSLLGGAETCALAAPGVVTAAVLWLLAAPSLRAIPGTDLQLLPHALVLAFPTVLGIALGVLGLLSGFGAITLWAEKGSAPSHRVGAATTGEAWRVAPLGAAAVLMVGARLAGGPSAVRGLLFGLLLTLVSLPLAMPWLVHRLGNRLAQLRGSESWLAGRRLAFSPVALARPAVAVGALVFVAGTVTGIHARLASTGYSYESDPPVNDFLLGWRDSRPEDMVWLRQRLPQAAIGVVTEGNSTSQASYAACQEVARAVNSEDRTACPSARQLTTPLQAEFEQRFHMSVVISGRNLGAPPGSVADVIVSGDPTATAERIWRLTNNRLSAVNLQRIGPEPLAPPAATSWIAGTGVIAVLLLLLTMLHAFGNRTLALVAEDNRLLRLGLDSTQVKVVQRWTLVAPLAISILVGTMAALVFVWAGDSVELALPATRLILIEALAVAMVVGLATLAISSVQHSWVGDATGRDGLEVRNRVSPGDAPELPRL